MSYYQKKHLAASGKHPAAGQGCASSTANPVVPLILDELTNRQIRPTKESTKHAGCIIGTA